MAGPWRRARTRANTLRAQKADGRNLSGVLRITKRAVSLPADPKTIRAFIEDRVKAGKKPATIKRYVATISRVHMAARLLNPLPRAKPCDWD